MIGIIVASGLMHNYSYYKKYFDHDRMVICADGGALHLKKMGIKPDILLGDFDSISKNDLNFFKDMNVEILSYPKEKDMTDTHLAVKIAVERGCRELYLLGCTGSRLDHSLSNIFLLKQMIDIGIKGTIVNENNEVSLICDSIEVKKEDGFKITVLPMTDKVEGIKTSGLYYELNDFTINMGDSIGVSNEFVADGAQISIKSGLLLVIKSKD
ncbi:UNVERIFIED_CONTAM: thiamine pyrophosphokinase [Acetivibrio alkalicellulosi]